MVAPDSEVTEVDSMPVVSCAASGVYDTVKPPVAANRPADWPSAVTLALSPM